MRRQRASYVKLSARRRLLLLSLRLVKMDLGGLPDMVRRVLRFPQHKDVCSLFKKTSI